jgi:hypothetical protein
MADVRLTQEQFNDAIKAAAQAGAEAAVAAMGGRAAAQPLSAQSPEEQFQAQKEALFGSRREGPPHTFVKNCESVTGAKFTARIDHRGIIVNLDDYTHPAGTETLITEGGLVPSGYKIGGDQHKQWKWSSFWQADINAFVGKALPAHVKRAAESSP